jgi:hypothetical protein
MKIFVKVKVDHHQHSYSSFLFTNKLIVCIASNLVFYYRSRADIWLSMTHTHLWDCGIVRDTDDAVYRRLLLVSLG